MVMLCLFSGFVRAQFSQKLTDMVKEVDEPATMTFSTEYTAPDLLRVFRNGTSVTLVSSGRVMPAYSEVGSRYHVISNKGDHGFNVTVIIRKVSVEDAGTYLARSDNNVVNSSKHYVEFVVTGRPVVS